MINDCFDVLHIAPTKEKTVIKKAYRSLLHQVNPEDDPKGFQALREAYEEACKYAGEKKSKKKESASEQFITQCEDVYASFFRRIERKEWEELLVSQTNLDLDTEEEFRRAFLTFLMTHFHLPWEVWQLIDQIFSIRGNRKELVEWFPEDYVDFLLQAVQYEGVLKYALFEGEADADFDAYIEMYQKLRQYTDMGLLDQAEEALMALSALDVYHPYAEVEKARLLLQKEEKEAAGALLRSLAEKYVEEERILCCYGQYLQMEERWEELRGFYDRLLENNPDSLSARMGKAEETLHQGEYRKAREMILDLLECSPQDERLLNDLMDANVFMIDELEEKKKEGELSQDEWMEYSWCLYQNMKFEEAIDVLDEFEPDEEHLLDYHNLKGRVYLTLDKNEEALNHLLPWLQEIKKVRPDGTKKTQRKLARLGYAYYTIGSAQAAILLKEKKKDFTEPMWYFAQAIAEEKEESQVVSYYHTVADIWRQIKEYGKVVDACDHMLAINQGYYPAVLLRQDACLHLGMFQEVMDDYQRAVYMYPYYGKPYATLIKMYFIFGEYDKVREILALTREKEIESDSLGLLASRYKALMAKTPKELEEALALLDRLKEKGWSMESDIEQNEWNEIDYRRGLILTDLHRTKEALEALRCALKDHEEDVPRLLSYASALMQAEQDEEAVVFLHKAETLAPEDEGILYRLGWCYKRKKEYAQALAYMKKVLRLNENHPGVRQLITEIYERMARKEENNLYYQKALPFMQEQVRRYPEEYFLMEMGLLYLDMDRYEEALSFFRQAYEKNPESIFAYNNAGNCYMSMNMPQKAEAYLQKAVQLMKNEIVPLPYTNLAKCYRMMGKKEQALFYYEKARDLFPDRSEMYLLLGEFYRENQRFAEAIATYRQGIVRGKEAKALEFELLRTYGIMKDRVRVEETAAKLKEAYGEDGVLYQLLGEIWLYGLEDYRQAEVNLERAVELMEEQKEEKEGLRGSLYLLGRCRLLLGIQEGAMEIFQQCLGYCQDEQGDLEQFVSFYGEQSRRKLRLGFLFLFMDNKTEAEKYFREMCEEPFRCDGCGKACCYEKCIGEAMILWMNGKEKQALALYEKAVQAMPDDMEHRFEYEQMKKWEESL